MARLETRVARIADASLAERRFVRSIDVLVVLGWLAQPNVDRWEWEFTAVNWLTGRGLTSVGGHANMLAVQPDWCVEVTGLRSG
jgi:hypothetical protein